MCYRKGYCTLEHLPIGFQVFLLPFLFDSAACSHAGELNTSARQGTDSVRGDVAYSLGVHFFPLQCRRAHPRRLVMARDYVKVKTCGGREKV